LRHRLADVGLHADVEFLYAVFEDRAKASHGIYYHGQVQGPAPKGMAFCPLTSLDWAAMRNLAERSMLQRYSSETESGEFGIYQGNETEGKVRRLSGA